jgi:hypothetical protein
MNRRQPTETIIRKLTATYLQLLAYVARLDYQIYCLEKRLAKIALDEAKWLARRVFLTDYLQHLSEAQSQLEAQALPVRMHRAHQKRLDKHIAQARKQWYRNEIHLINLEKRKQKDNVVKLVRKQIQREQVQLRADHTLATLQQLEYQQQIIEQDIAALEAAHATIAVSSKSVTVSLPVSTAHADVPANASSVVRPLRPTDLGSRFFGPIPDPDGCRLEGCLQLSPLTVVDLTRPASGILYRSRFRSPNLIHQPRKIRKIQFLPQLSSYFLRPKLRCTPAPDRTFLPDSVCHHL